jgi:hypothetical protein
MRNGIHVVLGAADDAQDPHAGAVRGGLSPQDLANASSGHGCLLIMEVTEDAGRINSTRSKINAKIS